MINPRSLIRALDKHWSAIEQIVLIERNQLSCERDDLLALLAKIYVNETSEQRVERLQNMVNSELLIALSRSNSFQLNEHVSQFVGSLLHEHELGLSEVLKARITHIKTGLEDLHQAVSDHDMAALQRAAIGIDTQLRQTLQQLEQDAHAIQAIAERAKASDNSMPLSQRYREVLEAFDRYIDPMTELMDTGAGGSFYPLLEQAEQVIETIIEKLLIQGGLYSHHQLLKQLNFRVKDLRQTGREVLKQCTNTLMPMREELRRHNQLSTAIGQLLGEVRKKGLRRTFPQQVLPLWRKERSSLISVGSEILSLMEEVRGYQARAVEFPDHQDEELQIYLERIDEAAVIKHLYDCLPVDDLMQWLNRHYHQYQDITLLRLYHKLICLKDISAEPNRAETSIALKQIKISLFSHKLEAGHD